MSGMPWVKLYTEILDDIKINRLDDDQKWRFIQLILMAAECDAEGALVTGDTPVSHEDVTKRLRCDMEEWLKDYEKILSLGLIFLDGDVIVVTNFANKQGPTQEEKRHQWRERQRKRRARVKKESPVTPERVTPLEEEEEEDSIASDDAPPKKPRQEPKRIKNRKILQAYFIEETGLPPPKTKTDAQARAAQRLWWGPLDEICKDLSNDNVDIGKGLIDKSLEKLNGMTVSDPNSIIKTARSVYADAKVKPTEQKFVEWS